jgi:hypothetical protein
MDDASDRLADKVQALSDIELAVLICLVADQHCIIETEKQLLDAVEKELKLVSRACRIHESNDGLMGSLGGLECFWSYMCRVEMQ